MLETERLIIRQFVREDAPFIVRLVNQPAFVENIGDKKVRSVGDALNYLCDGPLSSYGEFGYGANLVALKSNGQAIALCGLIHRDEFEFPDLGFAVLREYCGRGYAYEASKAVLQAAHEVHGLHTVLAIAKQSNTPSNSLLQKLGFERIKEIQFMQSSDYLYQIKLSKEI